MMRAPARVLTGLAVGFVTGGLLGCPYAQAAQLSGGTVTLVKPADTGMRLDSADPAVLRWAAEEMARHGYYGGSTETPDTLRLDGAIRAFRRDSGLPDQEPLLDDALRRQLGAALVPGTTADNRVLVVEELRCEGKADDKVGDWAVVYDGQRTAGAAAQSGLIPIRLDRRMGVRLHASAPDGIDPTDWACHPSRRICHAQADFAEWGGKLQAGEVVGFHPTRVLSVNGPWERQLASFVADQCGRALSGGARR